MTYTPKTTHVADSTQKLLSQFRPTTDGEKLKIAKLVEIYAQQVQDLEDTFRDLGRLRNALNFTGNLGSYKALDDLGALVGVQREVDINGSEGRVFWSRVQSQPLANKSNSSGAEITAFLKLLYGPYNLIATQSNATVAEYTVQLPNTIPMTLAAGAQIQRILRQMTAAGVKYFFTYYTELNYFGWTEDVGARRGSWLQSTTPVPGGFAF